MNSSSRTIAKNVSVLMMSQVFTWGLALLMTIFLPRTLGPTVVGYFYLAGAVWGIVGVMATFGTDTHLTKSIARNPATLPELLGSVLCVKTIFYFVGWVFVLVYVNLIDYPFEVVYVIYIVGLSLLIDLVNQSLYSALQGLELMEYTSLTTIVGKVLTTSLSLLLLFTGANIYLLAGVPILVSSITVALHVYFLRRRHPFRLQFQLGSVPKVIKQSAPYLVIGLTVTAYQQTDVLMIASLTTETAVGWYSSAIHLYGTLMFLPVAFMTAIFPPLTRSYASAPDMVSRLTRKSFDLLFIAGVPISLGLVVVSEQVVSLLLGPAFAQSGIVLRMLAFVLVFTYLNIFFGQTMISMDRTHVWTVVMLVAAVATIVMDIILVPLCDRVFGNAALGGALSYLVTESLMTIAAILMLPKGTMTWANVRCAALSLLAGLIMMAICWQARHLFLPIPILIGVLTYPALVLLFRIISPEDIALFRSLVSQVLARTSLRVRGPASVSGGQ